jgi:antitoxin MazE
MQVSKWGNSLAIRIPAALVDALNLKEGDQVEVRLAGDRDLVLDRDHTREEALNRLRALRLPLPPGFKFDREEANER